jgi:transposase InsO family protein
VKREVFSGLLEAKVLVEEYRNYYNQERAHSALGYLFGLPNTGGVCGHVRAGWRRRRAWEGTRIGNHTLIAAGTENGVRLVYHRGRC